MAHLTSEHASGQDTSGVLAPLPLAEVRRPDPILNHGASPIDLLLQYWLGVRRYGWQIVLVTLMAMAITALWVYHLPKQYESTAVIRVDPSAPDTSVVSNGPTTAGSGIEMAGMLGTDMAEITSPAVQGPAIQSLRLGAGPGMPRTYGASVTNPQGTFLLQIAAKASTPELAADYANALARSFLDLEFNTRSAALNDLSGYMSHQLQELQVRMERSELKLSQFLIDNKLPNPEAKFDQQNALLSSLVTEYDGELSTQRNLSSEEVLIKDGGINDLLVSDKSSAIQDTSEAIKQASIQLAKLKAQYGPGNYMYQEADREVQRLGDLIISQENDVAAQIEAEIAQNAAKMQSTKTALDQENAIVQDDSLKQIQYNELKTEASTDQSLYTDLVNRLNAAEITVGYRSTALREVDQARPIPSPVYPRPLSTLAMVGLLALAFGVGAAILIEGMDQTFTNPDAVRMAVGETILASLPRQDESGSDSLLVSAKTAGRRSLYGEAVLGLRTNLLLGSSGKVRTLMVVSAQPQEGKSTTAANLAAAYAVLGLRTVLVDADIRRPQVHRNFELPNRVGLSTLLQHKAEVSSAVFSTAIDKLFILPAGPAVVNPTELLAISIGNVIEELKAEFEIVIIDTPPLLDFADARTVAGCVDGCVLVVRAGMTPREMVISAVQELRLVRARISGIVLNGVNAQMSHYYHYRSGGEYRDGYSAQSRYYRDDDAEAEGAEPGAIAAAEKARGAAAGEDTSTRE